MKIQVHKIFRNLTKNLSDFLKKKLFEIITILGHAPVVIPPLKKLFDLMNYHISVTNEKNHCKN